jgi:hypothetical protein
MSLPGVRLALGAAVVIAAVSTLVDWIWAAWDVPNRLLVGVIHGTVLFLCVGLMLGVINKRPIAGTLGGAVVGFLAAGSYYLVRPVAGFTAMFIAWVAAWIGLAAVNEVLRSHSSAMRVAVGRGVLAAVASGVAFYFVSGIWRPFNPAGWDYLVHFGAWTLAFLPGFAALLISRELPIETTKAQ